MGLDPFWRQPRSSRLFNDFRRSCGGFGLFLEGNSYFPSPLSGSKTWNLFVVCLVFFDFREKPIFSTWDCCFCALWPVVLCIGVEVVVNG